MPAFTFEVAKLRREDENGKRIDEANLHSVGNEFEEFADAEGAKDEHDDAAEDGGEHKVFRSMVTYKADDDKGHGTGGCGDHGWASAEESEEDGEPEGGIESHHGADAGDDAKADDFRDDGEGGDEAGEDVTTNVAKPLLFFLFEVHKCQLPILK